MSQPKLRFFEPYAQSILRVITGYIILALGTNAMFGIPGAPKANSPEASLTPLLGHGAILEVVGGGLLILGLLTVPTALVLGVQMGMIYLTMFAPKGWALLPFRNGGPFPVYFSLVFLYLFTAGAGPWSLDGVIARMRRSKSASSAHATREIPQS